MFSGGSTVAAAERIAGAEIEGLESLIDKSLLVKHGDRVWMLETIRQYAEERLTGHAQEAAVRSTHLAYFMALAEERKAEPREASGHLRDARLHRDAKRLQHIEWTLAGAVLAVDPARKLVENRLQRVYDKLGISSRTEAARYAYRTGRVAALTVESA